MMSKARECFAEIFKKSARDLDMHMVYDVAHNIAKVEKRIPLLNCIFILVVILFIFSFHFILLFSFDVEKILLMEKKKLF